MKHPLLLIIILAGILSGCTSVSQLRSVEAGPPAAESGFRGVRMVTYTQESFPATAWFWRDEAVQRSSYAGAALRRTRFFSQVHAVEAVPSAGLHLHVRTSVRAERGALGNAANGVLTAASAGLVPFSQRWRYAHDVTVYRDGRVIQRMTYAEHRRVNNGVLLGVLTVPLLGRDPEKVTEQEVDALMRRVLADLHQTGALQVPLP